MTKGELRTLIREVLNEELAKTTALTEEVTGGTYVIKAWDNPEMAKGPANFDSSAKGLKYPDFDDVVKALQSDDLADKGVYQITWIQTGAKA